jgi:hypothetical protein
MQYEVSRSAGHIKATYSDFEFAIPDRRVPPNRRWVLPRSGKGPPTGTPTSTAAPEFFLVQLFAVGSLTEEEEERARG